MQNVPEKLYRGVRFNYNQLRQIKWYDVDIVPHYKPFIDNFGRKTVHDGNEYGVYMTDSYDMVSSAYGKSDAGGSQYALSEVRVQGQTPIYSPLISIIYEIDAKKVDVRRPWISQALSGHYNNGFDGNEWIADVIPKGSYKVKNITIGPDLLHDEEKIDTFDILEANEDIDNILKLREFHLKEFAKEVEKLSFVQRLNLSYDDMKIFKDFFGYNGIKYTDYDKKELKSGHDYANYLMWKFYNKSDGKILSSEIRKISRIKSSLKQGSSIEDLGVLLGKEILKNNNLKQKYIENCNSKQTVPQTKSFDQNDSFYNNMLDLIFLKEQSQNNKKQNFESKTNC